MRRRMDKEEFNQLFDKVFEKAVQEKYGNPINPKDIEASWNKVEQRLKQEKKRRK